MTEIQPRDDRLKYYENDAKIRHSFTIVDMLIYTKNHLAGGGFVV